MLRFSHAGSCASIACDVGAGLELEKDPAGLAAPAGQERGSSAKKLLKSMRRIALIFRLEFFGMSLNTPVILKSRVAPCEIDGERAPEDLVGAEALDRLGLRNHGRLRGGQRRARGQREA